MPSRMTKYDLQDLVEMALWTLGKPAGPAFTKVDVELPPDPTIKFYWGVACGALEALLEHLEKSEELT